MMPVCPSLLKLCAFLTGAIPKGRILQKNSLMFVYVLCKFVSGLILCFVVVVENWWFDDLCA